MIFYHSINMNLNDLQVNQSAKVVNINCTNSIKQRLLDLGLVNDTLISPIFSSPLGDPIAYEFRGNIIAIRKNEAKNIVIKTNF